MRAEELECRRRAGKCQSEGKLPSNPPSHCHRGGLPEPDGVTKQGWVTSHLCTPGPVPVFGSPTGKMPADTLVLFQASELSLQGMALWHSRPTTPHEPNAVGREVASLHCVLCSVGWRGVAVPRGGVGRVVASWRGVAIRA